MDIKTILLADDQAEIRDVLRIILEKNGFNVIVAEDGEDAIRKFKLYGDAVDVLLLDLLMPKKNGKEAYEVIKEMEQNTKVLFLSGYGCTEVIDDIKNEGLPFVSKPVTPDNLLIKIREIIEG